jgi:hypothetical protein
VGGSRWEKGEEKRGGKLNCNREKKRKKKRK